MARALLQGTALSPGIAIGKVLVVPDSRAFEKRTINEDEIHAEIALLQRASREACDMLENTVQAVPGHLAEYREIISAQLELARDSRILNGAAARIRHKRICAPWALSETINELCAMFQGESDPYLSERAQDIRSIGKCLMDALVGFSTSIRKDSSGILAAWEMSPADVMEYRLEGIQGLIMVEGGPTSHTSILARGLKLPAIAGVQDLFKLARNEETLILDGLSGCVLIEPDEEDIKRYTVISKKYASFENEAQNCACEPAITKNGVAVPVRANLESQQELGEYARSGAEGVGLYRTEYSYMRGSMPGEEELIREYAAVIAAAGQGRVIFRTLDAGADKILPVQEALNEPNPALGLRGIRFCLKRRDILRVQLRAILRAGAKASIAIMLPMISTLSEVTEVKAILAQISGELAREGKPHAERPPLGVMVETPAAVLICQELARECDFLSLGTNDLFHYLLAIDRNNRHVAYLYDPLHPGFLRAIKQVALAAHECHKPVSVCGELPTHPLGLAILFGLGIDSFSANPRFVPAIKQLLRQLDLSACEEIAGAALAGATTDRIKRMLRKALADCGEYGTIMSGPAYHEALQTCHSAAPVWQGAFSQASG